MYKKIMVAVDGSETAKHVLVEAENIANRYNATICIVHSVISDSIKDRNIGITILRRARSSIRSFNIELLLLEAKKQNGLNSIGEAIATAATDWNADLLVLGTTYRIGAGKFLIGSVAECLVTKVTSSVILVRPEKEYYSVISL